jgi:hypothetical protein
MKWRGQLILFCVVIVGIGVALLRGGSLRCLGERPLRLGWLAVVAFLVQAIMMFAFAADQLEAQRSLHAALLMGSYVALMAVVWANRSAIGVSVIGLGLLLNLTVMAANGGFMPVARDVILAASPYSAEALPQDGARLPRSKNVLLPVADTRLAFLSDAIVGPGIPVAKVYSLGDLVVALGAFTFVQMAMLPRRERGAVATSIIVEP